MSSSVKEKVADLLSPILIALAEKYVNVLVEKYINAETIDAALVKALGYVKGKIVESETDYDNKFVLPIIAAIEEALNLPKVSAVVDATTTSTSEVQA